MVEFTPGFATWWERIYDRLGAPAGASMSADIAAIDADVVTVDGVVDAILVDTADIQPKLGTPAVDISADIAAIDAAVGASQTDITALLADVGDASGAILGSLLGILGDPASTITAQISALNALLVLIQADIGADASSSTLGSLYGILGDPATDLATTLAAIKMVTDASLVLTETGSTLTTDGNVQTLYINDAPAGEYEPRVLTLDCTAHTAGETIELNEYYRIRPGGNYILDDTMTYAGLISPELIPIDLIPNRYGTWVTMQKTAGANRDYDWDVHYEV